MTESEHIDDQTIHDEDELWRRIPPNWWVFDKNLNRIRPTSQAFQDHRNGSPMSVFLGKECSDPQLVLKGHEGFSLAVVQAGVVRNYGLGIMRRPIKEFPFHAEVFGEKSKRVRSELAKSSGWVVPPSE